jgi:hypothetical protein
MSKAVLRPVDVPAKLVASMEKAIAADFPDRGMSGPEDYAQPHVRTDTERLINGDRERERIQQIAEQQRQDRLALEGLADEVSHLTDKLKLGRLTEEIKGEPLERLKHLIAALVYGDMMEIGQEIVGHPEFKPPTTKEEIAVVLHRYAMGRK